MKVILEPMGDSTTVIRLTGLLNAHTAPSLKEQIGALVEEGSYRLVLDLSQVDFIDSSGLAVLVSAMKRTRAKDGKLQLVGIKDNVLEVFKLTLLDKVFHFYPTVEAALKDPA